MSHGPSASGPADTASTMVPSAAAACFRAAGAGVGVGGGAGGGGASASGGALNFSAGKRERETNVGVTTDEVKRPKVGLKHTAAASHSGLPAPPLIPSPSNAVSFHFCSVSFDFSLSFFFRLEPLLLKE